jgi:hypothetical protein
LAFGFERLVQNRQVLGEQFIGLFRRAVQLPLQCVDAPKPGSKGRLQLRPEYFLGGLIRNAESVVSLSRIASRKACPKFEKESNYGMRMENRFSRLCGSSVRCASVALTFAFCASAFAADPSKNVVLRAQPQRVMKTAKKICYTFTTTSGIPVPCDRVSSIPTTASPMTIYRNAAIK